MREPRTWKKTKLQQKWNFNAKKTLHTFIYIYMPHTYKKGEFVRNNKEERHQSQELMMG
jgi:hypothetical protein